MFKCRGGFEKVADLVGEESGRPVTVLVDDSWRGMVVRLGNLEGTVRVVGWRL